MKIRKLREYTTEAFSELKKLQTGDKLLPKTGFDFIDNHLGGVLPGDVILISSLSGVGKTQTLHTMKKNILDTKINPKANDYIFLDVSLEMKVFNIILRGVANITNKKKSEILFNEFNDEEKERVKLYYEELNDDRQYINQTPTTPSEFYASVSEFLEEHKDRDAVFIALDHVLLMSGSDKQSVLEQLSENINQLKLRYDNVYFILLSQNNRGLLGRAVEKNNAAAPNASDVFGSSFLDQLCSFNIILYNPFKLGISQYMKVNPSRYEYLSEHFGEEDSKGRVSFETEGKIFAHVVKARESDIPFHNIFVINMDLPQDEIEKIKEKNTKPQLQAPNFPKQIEENPYKDVTPNFDLSGSFDKEEDNTDKPF